MPAVSMLEVPTRLNALSPFGVKLSSDRSDQPSYRDIVREMRQYVARARKFQEDLAQLPCETEFDRRKSGCLARTAAAISDLCYLVSDELANNPGRKMLADVLEDLGIVYEDLAESHALASSTYFADQVEKELADLASNTA